MKITLTKASRAEIVRIDENKHPESSRSFLRLRHLPLLIQNNAIGKVKPKNNHWYQQYSSALAVSALWSLHIVCAIGHLNHLSFLDCLLLPKGMTLLIQLCGLAGKQKSGKHGMMSGRKGERRATWSAFAYSVSSQIWTEPVRDHPKSARHWKKLLLRIISRRPKNM